MKVIGTPVGAAVPASLVAGPVFVLSYAASLVYARLPHPIVVDPETLLGLATILLPATIVGFMIGYCVNIVGALIMAALSNHIRLVREPPAWVAAGAAIGGSIAFLLDGYGRDGPAFALIATSAICAGLCRRGFDWVD
ncbi:MAG TPA: hypothetical protein VLK25_11695 [Allosphingosinicella sp.]|nr:hypothetical protein [Allosphingosinicella sp.]